MTSIEFLRVPLALGSGAVSNPTVASAVVTTLPVSLPGLSSFRLDLSGTTLESPGDSVVVTSAVAGSSHRLTAGDLARSRYQSAWINGDQAVVGLELTPGSRGSLVVAGATGIGALAHAEDICGSDDRVLSNDNRTCRLLVYTANDGGVCTGWMISDRATFLTAGHCFGASTNTSYGVTAEFNVPLSTPAGDLVHPPAQDQFEVDVSTLLWNEGSVGSDWAVGRIHPNESGLLPSAIHGWYNLATAVPSSLTGRLIGYGADNTPNLTRENVQQTSTDSLTWVVSTPPTSQPTTSVHHDIDSQPGNSGGPLLWEAAGLAVGIHTHGGCFPIFSSNRGTSIFYPPLQSAIATVNGCASAYLPDAAPVAVTCSPTIYTASPTANRWNIVGVSSTTNWNIQREGAASTFTGTICDFLLADGNVGAIPGISGELLRVSGTTDAVAQHASASPLTLGQTQTTSWNSQRILRAFQFSVTATGQPLLVNVAGDPSLRWHVYRPESGYGPLWRSRTVGLIGAGTVGGGITPTLSIPVTGTYCLVVYRDGGSIGSAPVITEVGVTVCTSGGGTTSLNTDTPTAVGGVCGRFSIDAGSLAGDGWKAVALSAVGSSSLTIGTASSALLSGRTEFAVVRAQPSLGFPVTVAEGFAADGSGSSGGVLELTTSGLGVAQSYFAGSIGPGHILDVIAFVVPSAASHHVLATGDSSLRWFLMGPGTNSALWRGPGDAVAEGAMGGASTAVTLSSGQHALVVLREGPVGSGAANFNVRVGLSSSNVALLGPGTLVSGIPPGSTQWSSIPAPGRWNAVAMWGNGLVNSWSIHAGSASAGGSSTGTSYCIADGRSGVMTPTVGLQTFSSSIVGGTSTLHQSGISTLSLGIPLNLAWANGQIIQIIEFAVPNSGYHSVQTTGASSLAWQLFAPSGSAAWRSRSTAAAFGTVGGSPLNTYLASGWHALVVVRGNGLISPPAGSLVLDVQLAPNPVPTITGTNPNAIPAGFYPISAGITVLGTGFVPGASVLWDGTAPIYIGTIAPNSMTISIPGGYLQVPGQHTLTVVNPAPGGGASLPFVIDVLAPLILSVDPPSFNVMTPASSAIPITVTGTGFSALATLYASGTPIPTTFVHEALLTGFITSGVAEALEIGGISITASNGHLAQSNTASIGVGPIANNRGTLVRQPLLPLPGQSYVAILEAGAIGQPFSLLADLVPSPPTPTWPDANANFVLGVSPFALTTLPLLDGLGLFGPPQSTVVFGSSVAGTPPGGTYSAAGFVWPTSPLGLRLKLQHVYLDPGSAVGYRLSWTRTEDL